jgi:N-acetylglutamate synthase-like GNAT family acetyltransferase
MEPAKHDRGDPRSGGLDSLVIREAKPNDVRLLADLIREAFQTVADRFGLTPENSPTHPSNCAPAWTLAAFKKGVRYFIAEAGGEASGCVALERTGPEVCYLERLAVLPRFRRQGLGQALVRHTLSQARVWGASRVELGLIAQQSELLRFYERLGFTLLRTARFDHLLFEVAFMAQTLQPERPRSA